MVNAELEKIKFGDSEGIYISKGLADILNNEIDGIHCLAKLMEYDVRYESKKTLSWNNNSHGKLRMSFYKGEDFYFDIGIIYRNDNLKTERIFISMGMDNFPDRKAYDIASNFGLSVTYYDSIEVETEDEMEIALNFVKHLM